MIVNILLFDDFELLDAFGPAEVFGKIPEHFLINYVSMKGDFINSTQGAKIWTEPVDADKNCDVLVIPGGRGARKILHQGEEAWKQIKRAVENADACLMVEGGSGIVAQTGLLFRRKIVDCEKNRNWNQMFTAGISRVPDIEWIADGKYYSSRTTKGGMDISLALIADRIDIDVAEKIAQDIGYPWSLDIENMYY